MPSLFQSNAPGGRQRGSLFGGAATIHDPATDSESLLWTVAAAPFRAAGKALRVLDIVGRQAPWTLLHKGSAELGSLLGTRSDPVPSWAQAWEETERGAKLLKTLYPDTFAIKDAYKDLDHWHTKLLGGLMEIGGDLLNVVTFLPKTARGTAASKVGELGLTFAEQAKRSERAAIGLVGGRTIKSEPIVKAVGAFGRYLGDTRAGSVLRRAFSTDLWHPGMRAAGRVMDQAQAGIRFKQIALEDALDEMRKGIPEDVWKQVTQASEHVHRPGWRIPGTHHNNALKPFSPTVRKMGEVYQGLTNTALDLAQTHGLARPTLNAGLETGWRQTAKQHATLSKEYAQIADEMAGLLPPADKKFVDLATAATKKAAAAQDEAFDFAMRADELVVEGQGGSRAFQNAVLRSNNATRVAQRLERKAGLARVRGEEALALAAQRKYLNPGRLQRTAAKMKKTSSRMATYEKLMDDRPAYIPHILDQKAQRMVAELHGGAGQKTRMWSDQFHGMTERHFALRYDPKTLKEVGGAAKLEKSLLRSMSITETEKVLRNKPFVADQMAKYQKLASKEGLIERIKRMFKGGDQPAPRVKAERLFNLDPAEGLKRLNRNITHAVGSKAFIEEMAKQSDVFSRFPREDGWFRLRDVSQTLEDTMGEGWIHPDLFAAIRTTYTRAYSGGVRTAVGHAVDEYTKLFKRAVTTPESLPGIRRIPVVKQLPLWPAYHWRNNISDFTLMGYNGMYSPRVVATEGIKAAWQTKGTIWAGKTLGHVSPAEINRLGRAYGVTFGEIRSMGAQGLGVMAENSRRLGYYVDRLQRGWSPYEASLEVKKVLFDYGDLTPFEQTYMRRVIPFYSWLRKNLGLQTKTLLQRPAIIQAQARLGTTTKKDDVPSWVRGRMLFALDPDQQTGEERYFIGFGLPVENLTEILDFSGGAQEWWRQMAFQANPLLKLTGLLPTLADQPGYDLERAREMRRPARADYLGWVERNFPEKWEWLQKEAGASKREFPGQPPAYYMDPRWDYVIRNSPLTRVHSTLKGAARSDTSMSAAALRYLTGYGVIRVDAKRAAEQERRSESRALLRAMERRGEARAVEIFVGTDEEQKQRVKELQDR